MRFTFKCLIIRNPGATVIVTLWTSIFILSYILRIFERPYYDAVGLKDYDEYFNSVWCIVITMTTVGFGDILAFSYFGRVVIMITAFWGAFLISLVIVSVRQIFELTQN